MHAAASRATNMISPTFISELAAIVGQPHCLTAPEDLLCYAYDATRIEGRPDAVVQPATTDEVSRILRLANNEGIPVTPRGAGSGLTGGAVAMEGGIVLSTERMRGMGAIDRGNLLLTVQPGVITGDIHKYVESQGLFYPPDPSSSAFCTIGGNVAENAGGPRALKYGVTADYVKKLEAVLPSGEVIEVGTANAKGVVGYDLLHLLVGSEGTLAVVTGITLRLIPKPPEIGTLTAFFRDEDTAATLVARVFDAGIIPRAVEFMDRAALAVAGDTAFIPQGGRAALIIETDGKNGEAEREMDAIRLLCEEAGALEIRRARDNAERESLWKLRKNLSQAMYRIAPSKINEDIVVPRTRLAEMVAFLRETANARNVKIAAFGHAGDGNIHVNVMADRRDKEEYERALEVVGEVFRKTVELGGTISGEHGVGLTKLPYVGMELGPEVARLSRGIKALFDPKGILNPGKAIPGEQGGRR